MHHEWTRDGHTVSTDPARLDRDLVHGFLTTSYWSEGIPREVVDRSIDHSLPFGLYDAARQVGFARVITDRATFAYLGDVFVLPEARGRKLGEFLVECVVTHPELQNLRRWVLLTRDAHGLYRKFGFTEMAKPERSMERWDPKVYERKGPAPAGTSRSASGPERGA